MARVAVTFEDSSMGVTVIRVESEPHFPTNGQEPAWDHLTPAQASAFAAVMEVAGLADAYRLFVVPPA